METVIMSVVLGTIFATLLMFKDREIQRLRSRLADEMKRRDEEHGEFVSRINNLKMPNVCMHCEETVKED